MYDPYNPYGRTILQNAFVECDGKIVPLVWNHKHDGANNVLGHCLLENRDDGVYCYGVFNDNPDGQGAKELVRHILRKVSDSWCIQNLR